MEKPYKCGQEKRRDTSYKAIAKVQVKDTGDIQTAHAAQYQKNKHPNQKMERRPK